MIIMQILLLTYAQIRYMDNIPKFLWRNGSRGLALRCLNPAERTAYKTKPREYIISKGNQRPPSGGSERGCWVRVHHGQVLGSVVMISCLCRVRSSKCHSETFFIIKLCGCKNCLWQDLRARIGA